MGIFNMHADKIGSGLNELVGLAEQYLVVHHQVDMQRLCSCLSHGHKQIGEIQKRWRKMSVGHVDMINIGMGFDAFGVSRNRPQISRPQRHFGEQAV